MKYELREVAMVTPDLMHRGAEKTSDEDLNSVALAYIDYIQPTCYDLVCQAGHSFIVQEMRQ